MTALELGHCLYLISNQRFESVFNTPCKVKPSSHDRWALTGVPHGNLSLAHTEVFTVASYPRILSSLTCTRSLTGCFQHAHSPCPQEGVPPSKDYSDSNSMILQTTSVYCVP